MSRPSKAEQRLDRWFGQQLPEPFAVYRYVAWLSKADGDEPRDGEADFVVAHPELGIMVIEVKGGGIRRSGGRWESVDRTGSAHPIKDPFAQVTEGLSPGSRRQSGAGREMRARGARSASAEYPHVPMCGGLGAPAWFETPPYQ